MIIIAGEHLKKFTNSIVLDVIGTLVRSVTADTRFVTQMHTAPRKSVFTDSRYLSPLPTRFSYAPLRKA